MNVKVGDAADLQDFAGQIFNPGAEFGAYLDCVA
jgi:hypothetical protein